jgi:AcrR family transcriptional regulator
VKPPLSPKPRNPARQEAFCRRQEEILAKAIAVFAEHGYATTDTQFLADQLQVGKGTLYRYFKSKEELFLAAVDYGMRRFNERMAVRLAGVIDPLDQIRQGICTFLEFFAENPQFVELQVQERALFKDRRKPTFFQYREHNILRWQALYRDLIAQRRVRSITPEQITNVVADLLYGTMIANYFAGRRPDPDVQARDIFEVVFRGILSASERGTEDGKEEH